jgi:hypothetical protein
MQQRDRYTVLVVDGDDDTLVTAAKTMDSLDACLLREKYEKDPRHYAVLVDHNGQEVPSIQTDA